MGRRRQTSHIYKRPDSGVYWCWYYDTSGRLHRESTRAKTKPGAEAALAELERRASDSTYAASHTATIERAIAELVTHRRDVTLRAEGTVKMYESKGGHLVRILGAKTSLGSLTARMVDGYISKRLEEGAARTTVSKELTTLRASLKLARRRREFALDPAVVIPEFAAEYQPKRRFLTHDEVERLLAQLEPDRAARVAWIIATGARWAESCRAERADVEKAQVLIRGTKTRTSKRVVPVLPDSIAPAAALLKHALRHAEGEARLFRPWGNVRRDLAAACVRAGIAKCTPNDLRRTLATWVRAHGVAPTLIGSLLGHTDGRMVERVYGALPPDQLLTAIVSSAGHRETSVIESSRSKAKRTTRGNRKPRKTPSEKAKTTVPRDGIEPPTRGFSIPAPKGRNDEKRRGLRLVA